MFNFLIFFTYGCLLDAVARQLKTFLASQEGRWHSPQSVPEHVCSSLQHGECIPGIQGIASKPCAMSVVQRTSP